MARENPRKKKVTTKKKDKVVVTDGVAAVVTKKEKPSEEPKSRYDLRYVGVNPFVQNFAQGVWYPVSDEMAPRYADKRNFEVRDNELGEIVSCQEIEASGNPDANLTREDRIALRKERQAREKTISLSLTANHKKNAAVVINGVPHEPDYVPNSETDDLPPAGVPIGEDGATPTHILKAPRSQRMTDSDMSAIDESRIAVKDAVELQFDSNQGVATVADKFSSMRIPPRRG